MGENVITLDEKSFDKEVIQEKLPVMVDFWAAWCVPCKMLAPTIEDLAREYAGRVKFGKINVDENREMIPRYGIRGIPTLLLFKEGKVVSSMIGDHRKQEIVDLIEKAL